MPVTPGFREYALEQLGRVVPGGVRARAMFGGVGVYAGTRFFALLADDTLYLKGDDVTRADFARAGMPPFLPGDDPAQPMSYYGVSPEVLDDVDALAPWVEKALAAADRKGRRRARKRRG